MNNFADMVNKNWNLLFHRPDPLGFCIIMKYMNWLPKYLSMGIEERREFRKSDYP